MELPSGGWDPCSTGFPHQESVLRTPLYQCTSWHFVRGCVWLQWSFSEDSSNVFAHFMMGDSWACQLTLCVPAHTCWVFNTSDQKQHDAWVPLSLLTWSHPEQLVFFPRWKTSSMGNVLLMWKKWNKKMAEALKGIKIDEFKDIWEVGKMFW